MTLLITPEELSQFLPLAWRNNHDPLKKFILQAQEFDLRPLLPSRLFSELISQANSPKFEQLLNGGAYVYKGENIHFLGLKACLSFFTYAHWILQSNHNDTPWGVVQKDLQQSTQISFQEKRDMQKLYQQKANEIFKGVELYLQREHPEYFTQKSHKEKKTFKISLI